MKCERIGYLREAVVGGRIGRLYPANEVGVHGYKAEAKGEERKG